MDARQALVEVLTGAFLVLGAWVTARYTGKGARQAAEVTAEVQRAANEATREAAFIQNLSARLGQLEALDSERVRHIQSLERRVGELEAKRRADREEIGGLRRFARQLLEFIRSHGLHAEAPEPPIGIRID